MRRNGVGSGLRRCALALAALPLAGCGEAQNSLALVVGLLAWSWKRRRRRGFGGDTSGPKPGEKAGWYVVVGAGIAMPIAVVAALFVVSDIFVIQTTQAPAGTVKALTVLVSGHQWWWEVRYPGTNAVTANEIHIPVRTPVRVEVQASDVIHSFWVPRLNRKIDMIPGRTNTIELYADAAGRYRGQCSEFCGVQHAHMALYVFADPPDVFRRWLARQARPARAPTGAQARAGERAFLDGACSTCHAIRGTPARAGVGPDLTHLAGRTTLAALTLPNTRAGLERWIARPQQAKPGTLMPDLGLSGRELADLVAYLRGLR